MGETYDFTFTPREPGDLTLEVRRNDGALAVAQPIEVVVPEEEQETASRTSSER